MFQFPGLTSIAGWHTFSMPGCPIRRSGDLMLVCSSPQLIAAYHVLHRLSEPRHPPYALKCFKRVITITRYLQLYYPNMSKNWSICIAANEYCVDVMVMNHQTLKSHQLFERTILWKLSEATTKKICYLRTSLKRRYSSRTFRYGYLVTT